ALGECDGGCDIRRFGVSERCRRRLRSAACLLRTDLKLRLTCKRPTGTPHRLSISFLTEEGSFFEMGTPSPYPWDLALYGRQDDWWGSQNCPTLSALESALGAHPCVALSSAQAFPA